MTPTVNAWSPHAPYWAATLWLNPEGFAHFPCETLRDYWNQPFRQGASILGRCNHPRKFKVEDDEFHLERLDNP